MILENTVSQIRNFKSHGRTQAWIARELRISRATVSRVLRGKWTPRRFHARQVLRLLDLWDTLLSLNPGGRYVGWCRACREPVHLPCVSCLAGVIDSFGVRTPAKWFRGQCECGGNFTGVRPPPQTPTVYKET
jgi:DNA-binding XRE family transcriptional regulator